MGESCDAVLPSAALADTYPIEAIRIMMATSRLAFVLILAMAVSACGTFGGTAATVGVGNVIRNNAEALRATEIPVGIPRHSPFSSRSALSSIAPATVQVIPFNDDRKDLDSDGQVSAAFGLPMGRIRFEPSPATLLGQVMVSEIKAAGHLVTDGAEGAPITGAVLEFDTRTATTPLYWDVIGTLAVSLQIPGGRETNAAAPLNYRAQCMDRIYVWPSEVVIAKVMRKCIDDFASQLRDDGRAADALRNLATKDVAARSKADELRSDVAPSRASTERSYTHPEHRWSVSYPGNWKLDEHEGFVKISRGQAILGVHALSGFSGLSLDELADSAIKAWEQKMQAVNVVRRVSRRRLTLADDVMAIAIEHHIGAGQVGKSQKIIVAVNDRRYLIDVETLLASWTYFEPEFKQIIESFKVLR